MAASAFIIGTLAWGEPAGATPAGVSRPNPCSVVVTDPAGDAGVANVYDEVDVDVTAVTYRLGPHVLTATVHIPQLGQHHLPEWVQHLDFQSSDSSGEMYGWGTGGAYRTPTGSGHNGGGVPAVYARWDDARGMVTLTVRREFAVDFQADTGRVVALDLRSYGHSYYLADTVSMPLIHADACDRWLARR
jgi:hypothetical protein